MKAYYKDDYVTIYNCSTETMESDVIVLDPPFPCPNAHKFKATTYYIFCGNHYNFYAEQFQGKTIHGVKCKFYTPDSKARFRWISADIVLVVGNVYVPGDGSYLTKPERERYNDWERPVELMMNFLGSSSGMILDPFMGSGATLVAARMMGKQATGYEIKGELCEIAAERCRKC